MNRIEKHAKNTFIILMLIMLFWIFMSFIFQKLLFPPSKNNLTTYEALKYYTHLVVILFVFFIKRTKTSCQMFTINYILFKININPTIFTFNTFGHISNSICTNLIYFYRFSKFCRVNFSLFMY